MKSAWNQTNPPKEISPFSTKFQYEKLMLAGRRELEELPADGPVVPHFKKPIAHPKEHEETKELEE
jgi:hypothetical protein